MDFSFDETQLAVEETVRGVLSRESPSAQLWSVLQDAGLHVLSIPEEHGGAGLGAVEVGIVAQALGEAAVISPFVGAGIAGLVASRTAAGIEIDDWCKGIACGEVTAVSARAPGRMGVPEAVPVEGDAVVKIDGDFSAAQCAENARWLLIPTTTGPGLIDATQQGVTVVPIASSLGTEDPSAPIDSQFRLVDVRSKPVFGDRPDAPDLFADLHRTVFLSYASGLLNGALKLTADHLRSRTQRAPLGNVPGRIAGDCRHLRPSDRLGIDVPVLQLDSRQRWECQHRTRCCPVHVRGRGARGDADVSPLARGTGCRRHLPNAQVLLIGQGCRAPLWW